MCHRFQWISSNHNSSNWLVRNSQMANFSGLQGDYQITFKRGGRIMELIAEAEWLVTTKKATHVLIDGIQNNIPDIVRGYLDLEADVLQRLKVLNRRALVVLAKVLYSTTRIAAAYHNLFPTTKFPTRIAAACFLRPSFLRLFPTNHIMDC